jgi:hypothetical protein
LKIEFLQRCFELARLTAKRFKHDCRNNANQTPTPPQLCSSRTRAHGAGSLSSPLSGRTALVITKTGVKFPPHDYDPNATPGTVVTNVTRRNGQIEYTRRIANPIKVPCPSARLPGPAARLPAAPPCLLNVPDRWTGARPGSLGRPRRRTAAPAWCPVAARGRPAASPARPHPRLATAAAARLRRRRADTPPTLPAAAAQVMVDLQLNAIFNVNEKGQGFSADFTLVSAWNDSRLNNPASPPLKTYSTSALDQGLMWGPRLTFANRRDLTNSIEGIVYVTNKGAVQVRRRRPSRWAAAARVGHRATEGLPACGREAPCRPDPRNPSPSSPSRPGIVPSLSSRGARGQRIWEGAGEGAPPGAADRPSPPRGGAGWPARDSEAPAPPGARGR